MTPAPVIIAIDGRSGAGKTTLAVELAARLREHHKVSLFHLEDIYPGWNGLAAGVDRYVSTVLQPLQRGRPAEWVSWDWNRHYDGATRTTQPAEIVLVEGVGAAAAAARPFLHAAVWVESPDQDRRRRALERDGASYEPFWDQWAAQEQEWLAGDDVPAHANVRVLNLADGGAPEQVLECLHYLSAVAPALSPELTARRGLQLQAVRVNASPDAARLFERLFGSSANAVWLDSSLDFTSLDPPGSDPSGADWTSSNPSGADGTASAAERSRFSILADDGGRFGQTVRHSSGGTSVSVGNATVTTEGPFFRWLDGAWGRGAVQRPESYPCEFALGWLGYLGYELKRETGGSDVRSDTPDACLLFAGRAVVLDHRERAVWLLVLDTPDADDWLAAARAAVADVEKSPATEDAEGTTGKAGSKAEAGVAASRKNAAVGLPSGPVFFARDPQTVYKAKVSAAQHEIAEGNSYEVCLTTALTGYVPTGGLDPWRAYLALRRRNPAPFASYLRFGGLTVASTSPERFLRITADGGMRAEPIKGTRPRHADAVLDARLRQELEASAKDRAENIMIVDLLRNDLSHFAVPGSVSVSRLCAVESYATVHQMVSTIDARLRPGMPRAEAVAACFPAGSMTGAPKVSSMAILDRLEGAPRGVYSGAIGYFSLSGAADLAVAIRTLLADGSGSGDGGTRLVLGVGGAVTADSTPEEEYEEIRTKAFGVLSALGSVFPPA